MSSKTQPLGICDLCLNAIPAGDWYTSKGKPRRFCSVECKQTANSRAGSKIKSQKLKERINAGTWINPRSAMTAEQIHAVQSRASRKARLNEIERGEWRNPGLSEQARRINSLKNKQRMDVAGAVERLRSFLKIPDAHTSSDRILLDRALLPAHTQAVRVQYAYRRLTIAPVFKKQGEQPKETIFEPYAICFTGDRAIFGSARLMRDAKIPRGNWQCVQREGILVFERLT